MGLETVKPNGMVKAVEPLSHLITIRRDNQIILLLNPVQGQVLLVHVVGRFVVFFVEPQADLNDIVFDHVALSRRANAARKHVNAPLNHCTFRQGSADTFRNHFTPFAHGVFRQHAIALEFAFFIFHPDT